MCNEMSRPRARTNKDEATGFNDRGGDASITHGDSREAGHACERVGNANSAHGGNTGATSALPFEMAKQCAYNDHDKVARFYNHNTVCLGSTNGLTLSQRSRNKKWRGRAI